jgi:signal transduction histidine kinase
VPSGRTVDREKLLQLVGESGEHLRTLMRDVLDLQRLEAGRFDLALQPVDVAAAMQRAAGAVQAQAAEAGVALQAMPTGSPTLRVRADPDRLHQCLLNLLTNALKYGSSGRRVELEWAAADGQALLAVQDHGCGLTPEQLEHLFEPFNRLGRSGGQGAGVGLALTRLLATAMGGELSVRTAPGEGCRFTLTLPLEP